MQVSSPAQNPMLQSLPVTLNVHFLGLPFPGSAMRKEYWLLVLMAKNSYVNCLPLGIFTQEYNKVRKTVIHTTEYLLMELYVERPWVNSYFDT